MATEAIYTKSLGGAEDLLLDASNSATVIQTRAGKELEITKINSSTIPYSGKFGDPSMVSIKDQLELSAYVIDTVDDFGTVPSGIDTVIVKDMNRGGTFIYDATESAVNNGGTVFDGWVRQYSGAVNVKWFGAKGDGATDDTEAIQNTVDSAHHLSCGILVSDGTYIITSTINIANKNLRMTGVGIAVFSGNFDGFLIDGSGTVGNYASKFHINGVSFTNTNEGTSMSSAGCIRMVYTGECIIEKSNIVCNGSGIVCTETISALFKDISMTCSTGAISDYSRGYIGQGRNTRIEGGRVYAARVALDIAGDSWEVNGVNVEWSDVCIRTRSTASAKFSNCHMETSGCFYTNASILPTFGTTWVDNGGDGIGLGAITFDNCHVGFLDKAVNNGVRSSLFVIKPQPDFGFRLNIIGCAFYVPNGLASINTVFSDTATGNMPSGTKVAIYGTQGFIRPTVIPVDLYTGYTELGSSSVDYSKNAQIDYLLGKDAVINVSGQTFSGASAYRLGDNNQKFYLIDGIPTISNYAEGVDILASLYYSGKYLFRNESFAPSRADISLGNGTLRWGAIYSTTGTINTSDDREKTYLTINEKETLVAKELKGLVKKFKFNDAITEKGEDKARIHYGTSAQEVIVVFEKNGLNAMDYAMVCYDEWEEIPEVKDEDVNVTQEHVPAGNRYGIRYEELIMFILGAM